MRNKLVVIGLFLVLIVGAGLYQWLAQPLVPIKKISCQLNDQDCPTDLTSMTDQLLGQSMFFSDLESQLIFTEYQLTSLTKKLPHTIYLQFVTRPARYQLSIPAQHQTYFVSATGQLISTDTEVDLPQVVMAANVSPVTNEQLNPKLDQIFQLALSRLKSEGIDFQKITYYQPNQIEIELSDQLVAVIDDSQTDHQIQKLAAIINKLNLDGVELAIHQIDLRFKLPVLKTSRSTSP